MSRRLYRDLATKEYSFKELMVICVSTVTLDQVFFHGRSTTVINRMQASPSPQSNLRVLSAAIDFLQTYKSHLPSLDLNISQPTRTTYPGFLPHAKFCKINAMLTKTTWKTSFPANMFGSTCGCQKDITRSNNRVPKPQIPCKRPFDDFSDLPTDQPRRPIETKATRTSHLCLRCVIAANPPKTPDIGPAVDPHCTLMTAPIPATTNDAQLRDLGSDFHVEFDGVAAAEMIPTAVLHDKVKNTVQFNPIIEIIPSKGEPAVLTDQQSVTLESQTSSVPKDMHRPDLADDYMLPSLMYVQPTDDRSAEPNAVCNIDDVMEQDHNIAAILQAWLANVSSDSDSLYPREITISDIPSVPSKPTEISISRTRNSQTCSIQRRRSSNTEYASTHFRAARNSIDLYREQQRDTCVFPRSYNNPNTDLEGVFSTTNYHPTFPTQSHIPQYHPISRYCCNRTPTHDRHIINNNNTAKEQSLLNSLTTKLAKAYNPLVTGTHAHQKPRCWPAAKIMEKFHQTSTHGYIKGWARMIKMMRGEK